MLPGRTHTIKAVNWLHAGPPRRTVRGRLSRGLLCALELQRCLAPLRLMAPKKRTETPAQPHHPSCNARLHHRGCRNRRVTAPNKAGPAGTGLSNTCLILRIPGQTDDVCCGTHRHTALDTAHGESPGLSAPHTETGLAPGRRQTLPQC